MANVFIDGSAGTTGLRIVERLMQRKDITLLRLPDEQRKDPAAKKEMINRSDITFLCLPDAAAVESAALCDNPDTVIIDTSTAHRTHPDWEYGMPELCGRRDQIRRAKRIANPGCHASGFIALVAPLIERGLLTRDVRPACFSLTGYSGGGKKMIAEYESDTPDPLYAAPRMYALSQQHKHLGEMQLVCSLSHPPVFCPVVAPFYSGMQVTVSLYKEDLSGTPADIRAVYAEYFDSGLIRYEDTDENGFLSALALSGRDDMTVAAFGCDERITLVSRFDNLGKGASGAAIQNMNLALGIDEKTGLVY